MGISSDIGCYNATGEDLLARLEGVEEIELEIDSHGGGGVVALTAFKGLAGRVKQVRITGKCWSAATIIAMAGDKITMARTGSFMVHAPSLGVYGTVPSITDHLEQTQSLGAELAEIFANSATACHHRGMADKHRRFLVHSRGGGCGRID